MLTDIQSVPWMNSTRSRCQTPSADIVATIGSRAPRTTNHYLGPGAAVHDWPTRYHHWFKMIPESGASSRRHFRRGRTSSTPSIAFRRCNIGATIPKDITPIVLIATNHVTVINQWTSRSGPRSSGGVRLSAQRATLVRASCGPLIGTFADNSPTSTTSLMALTTDPPVDDAMSMGHLATLKLMRRSPRTGAQIGHRAGDQRVAVAVLSRS